MISTRRKLFIIAAVVISLIWGGIFGFANPFMCDWPSVDDLLRSKADLPTSSIAVDLRHSEQTRFEEMIVNRIVQTEFLTFRFDRERDFVGHAMPELLRVWRYDGDRWISVDEKAAISEVQRPLEMVEYFAGDYARLFRFAVTHISATHACVMVEAEERRGGGWDFLHVFRSAFGLGPWWILSEGWFGWAW